MSFFTTDGFSARVTKITPRIGDSWTQCVTFWFLRPFWLNEMVILSTISKAVYWEALHQYSRSSFQSCLIWIFPWIKLSGYFFFRQIWKIQLILAASLENVSLENSEDFHLYFQVGLLHLVCYFFFFYWSPPSPSCIVFDAVASNKNEVLLIFPSTNA